MENVKRNEKGQFVKGCISLRKKPKVEKICQFCKKVFFRSASPSFIKLGHGKFCSRSCLGKFYISVTKPWKINIGKPAHNKGVKYLNLRDEGSKTWKGSGVGIKALHKWVARHRGKPMKCEHCGTTDININYEWANVDHLYKRKLDDFIRLCRSCHRLYDIKVNGYIPVNLK